MMPPRPSCTARSGFTLIEAMLSLTMASGIILLAYSAVRTGAKVSANADRLQLQSNLIVVGYLQVIQQGRTKAMASVTSYNLYDGSAATAAPVAMNWPEAPDAYVDVLGSPKINIIDKATGATLTLPVSTTNFK